MIGIEQKKAMKKGHWVAVQMYLSDPLHRLAGELCQVAVQRQLVVQDLVCLDLNICSAGTNHKPVSCHIRRILNL